MKILLLPENSCLADSLMIRIPGILDPPLLYTASFICILPGRPRTVWMKTIQQDLKSNNLSLDEAIDMARNHPLWRLMSTFGVTHS